MKIKRPTLFLNKKICRSNISNMVRKVKHNNLSFRPHFKTHQSAEIGNWYKQLGVTAICVSSVKMAQYFADNGWQDITISFPVNLNEIEDINKLARSINLNLLVENKTSILALQKHIASNISVFIKVDVGYHRTGVDYSRVDEIEVMLREIDLPNKIKFIGFLSHFGNTYNSSSKNEIENIYNLSVNRLLNLKSIFIERYPDLLISVGDTPSSSVINSFPGINELRPGNFVFYDAMQYYLGSCTLNEIAICLACPIVAKHENRSEIVIYGGAVHLSKEFIINKGYHVFGLVALFVDGNWKILKDSNFVKSLSQEHGIIHVDSDLFNSLNIGDTIGVIPVHSCLTANLADEFVTLDNDVIQMM